MKIKVGISNRHVHLKQEDLDILFGEPLDKEFDLNQPNNFASTSFVDLKTSKSAIEHVRVLGEIREYTQVEISKTDAYKLGLNPPVRTSGDLDNSELITIIGPKGTVTLNCCIIADRHIHITEEDKLKYRLNDTVNIKIDGIKGGTIDNVHLKVGTHSYFELHLDTDDANAFLLKNNDEVEIKD